MKTSVASSLIILFSLVYACTKKADIENQTDEPFDKAITSIITDNNNLWVGTEDGLYMHDGNTWETFKYPETLVANYISALELSNDGVLYVGTDMGISSFDNQAWISIKTDDGLFNNDIRCLDCDAENVLWIGTRNNRLVKYNDGNFTNYHVNPEASGSGELGHIHTISHDNEGNIWVGSCISGLSKFDGSEWTHTINDISVFATSSLCCENGDILIGGPYGVYKYSEGIWSRYTSDEGLASNNVSCFAEDPDNNNILIGTEMGLSVFDGQDFINYTIDNGLLDNRIRSLAFNNNGELWVGSPGGLQKFSY
jgi:ligand-binding sensor domain-containing protein